jgi:succinyl-diaminopimelate desuccinylase
MPNVVPDFEGGRGSGQLIVLNGHMDTYPVERPVAWKRGPFSGFNEGRFRYGRKSWNRGFHYCSKKDPNI